MSSRWQLHHSLIVFGAPLEAERCVTICEIYMLDSRIRLRAVLGVVLSCNVACNMWSVVFFVRLANDPGGVSGL